MIDKTKKYIEILAKHSKLREETIESGLSERVNKFPLRYVDAINSMQDLENKVLFKEKFSRSTLINVINEKDAEIKKLADTLAKSNLYRFTLGILAIQVVLLIIALFSVLIFK